MNRWSEREIARKLAEREPLEPPAGLLEKIKGEIPPTLPVGVPQPEARHPSPPPRRWLIAASLVAMVGAGFLALHLRTEAPRMEVPPAGSPRVERAAPLPRPSAPPPDEVPEGPGGTALPPPPPAAPKLLAKKEQDQLKSLGYAGPQARAEQQLQAGVSGGVVGGAPGGVAGGTVAAAPPPAAPVAAPQPKPEEDKITVSAESPLLDERRISTGATVNQAELERIPIAKSSPGAAKDRINVGGNEAGRQSDYVGPGNPYADAAAHPVSTFRLAAGTPPDAGSIRDDGPTRYYDFDAFEEMPVQGAVAITAEGAPTPFAHGPRFRLLRFHIGGVPTGSPVEVSFNPAVVARYRTVGDGTTGLYEVELRPDAPRAGRVATVRLSDPPGNAREVALSAFAPSWEKASPRFRLMALEARFDEIQRGAPATAGELDEIARQVREAGKGLPASARAAELADRVEKAARARN